ncbi:MAG: polymer-forming cytoskeletal protein [Candidatus Magasanikbacteria bacterium]|nr:polymer-forming cytoskeletal protein [Candidatus Magasanikbacteria bacterium]
MFKTNDSLNSYKENSQGSEYPQLDKVETVVGPSVVVEGDFSSEGNILVKGTVSGNVKTAQLLTVEQGAKILANVKAHDAVISGEVKGNVRANDRLELTESAKVMGDVSCNVLVVAAGALLQGKVSMKGLSDDGSDKKRTAKVKQKGVFSEDFVQETEVVQPE